MTHPEPDKVIVSRSKPRKLVYHEPGEREGGEIATEMWGAYRLPEEKKLPDDTSG